MATTSARRVMPAGQRHLAEQVAAAERDAPIAKGDLGGAGGDEVAGVALIRPPGTISSRGTANRGLSSFCTRSSSLIVEIGEQVEAPRSTRACRGRGQSEAGSLSTGCVLDAALEILVDLGRDEAFLEQGVVASHLAAQR